MRHLVHPICWPWGDWKRYGLHLNPPYRLSRISNTCTRGTRPLSRRQNGMEHRTRPPGVAKWLDRGRPQRGSAPLLHRAVPVKYDSGADDGAWIQETDACHTGGRVLSPQLLSRVPQPQNLASGLIPTAGRATWLSCDRIQSRQMARQHPREQKQDRQCALLLAFLPRPAILSWKDVCSGWIEGGHSDDLWKLLSRARDWWLDVTRLQWRQGGSFGGDKGTSF